jgi:hypothetical protein
MSRPYAQSTTTLYWRCSSSKCQRTNTTAKIQLKHQLSHPLSPNPVVHWFWRKRQSCSSLRGEQYCFKNQQLTRPRLEDMELKRRVPKIESGVSVLSRLKLRFSLLRIS